MESDPTASGGLHRVIFRRGIDDRQLSLHSLEFRLLGDQFGQVPVVPVRGPRVVHVRAARGVEDDLPFGVRRRKRSNVHPGDVRLELGPVPRKTVVVPNVVPAAATIDSGVVFPQFSIGIVRLAGIPVRKLSVHGGTGRGALPKLDAGRGPFPLTFDVLVGRRDPGVARVAGKDGGDVVFVLRVRGEHSALGSTQEDRFDHGRRLGKSSGPSGGVAVTPINDPLISVGTADRQPDDVIRGCRDGPQ